MWFSLLSYYRKEFIFNFANLSGRNITNALLPKADVFEKMVPLKAIRYNKMYTIKDHSMHTITCHDNGSYITFCSTKTEYFIENINSRFNTQTVNKSAMGVTSTKSKMGSVMMMLQVRMSIMSIFFQA